MSANVGTTRHLNPEDCEQGSLRTITLSEEEGIKAVVRKPKGKDTMEAQSYLFSKEKAKAWFEEHREIFSAISLLTVI